MYLVSDFNLNQFLDSFEYLTELHNLDAINPVRVKIRNHLSGAEFVIVGSYSEPRAPLVPVNGIWVNLDPSSLQYRTVYRLVAFTTNPDTPGFMYAWEVITTYDLLFTFPQDYTALVGSVGATGIIGSKGVIGYIGPIGNPGAQGVRGQAGPTGGQGPTGVDGIQGIVGDQGLIGQTGVVGPVGPSGLTGGLGEQGLTGLQGQTGDTGATGTKGQTGDIGIGGLTGATGANGATGLTFAGAWNTTNIYSVRQVVIYLGTAYRCTATNVNAIPSGTPSKWSILIPKGATGAQGATGPIGTYTVDYAYIRANMVVGTGIVIIGPTSNPSYPTSTNTSYTTSNYYATLYLSDGTNLRIYTNQVHMTNVVWGAVTVGTFSNPNAGLSTMLMINGTYIGGQSGHVDVSVNYKGTVYTGTLAVSTY